MSIAKKKLHVNRKNTPKAHGKRAVVKKFTRFKEIEQKTTKVQYGRKIKNYLLKLIYKFKERPVLAQPKQQKVKV